MILKNYKPFKGVHCETTATGSLLKQLDIHLSEPMLFGLGEGLSYIFWNMKSMDFPFIGGRVKPDVLTENICKNLHLELEIQETNSVKKAWENVQHHLDSNRAVGLKLDCYHLDYFTNKIHFAAHYVAMHGYDDQFAYLTDTSPQGSETKATLKNLELARNEKGPMSSRNRSYTIQLKGLEPELETVVIEAIHRNAAEYLNPPIKNVSYKGILKTAVEIKKWYANSRNRKHEFQTSSRLMEKAGTGGSIFRNLYRDFLKEAFELTGYDGLKVAYQSFAQISPKWKEVAQLFYLTGETGNIEPIEEASRILVELSVRERETMENLLKSIS